MNPSPSLYEVARILARVGAEHPEALRFAAQLLGFPACPACDYVMRPGHVCRELEAPAEPTA